MIVNVRVSHHLPSSEVIAFGQTKHVSELALDHSSLLNLDPRIVEVR
jgi:hypothetical protein